MKDADIHGRVQRTIQNSELDVTVIDGIGDGDGNNHRMLVSIRTNIPDAIELIDHVPETGKLTFVIVGAWEASQFEDAMNKLFGEKQ